MGRIDDKFVMPGMGYGDPDDPVRRAYPVKKFLDNPQIDFLLDLSQNAPEHG